MYLCDIRIPLAAVFLIVVPIHTLAADPKHPLGQQLVNGEQLYQKFCSACHGENGDANSRVRRALSPVPRNFTDPGNWDSLTYERMINAVTSGRPGTAMVGWQNRLSAQEIDGIVSYIRSTFMQPRQPLDTHPGKKIYTENCAVCHGDDGNSAMWTKTSLNPPPRDFTSPMARVELSRDRMINSVTFGRSGTAMVSFRKRLDSVQIEAVVGYIRSAFMKTDMGKDSSQTATAPSSGNYITGRDTKITPGKTATAGTADMDMAFPGGFVGESTAGMEIYQKNCFTCHGRKGNGQGPRSDFLYPKPRNFIHPDSRRRLNRPTLFAAISWGKPGTVMPSWNKVLSKQEIADVAEYVFTSFIRPANTGDNGHFGLTDSGATASRKKKVAR